MCVVGRLRIDAFSETRPALASPVTAPANTIAESNTLLFTARPLTRLPQANGATSFLNCQKIRARFSITCGQQRRQKLQRTIGEIVARYSQAENALRRNVARSPKRHLARRGDNGTKLRLPRWRNRTLRRGTSNVVALGACCLDSPARHRIFCHVCGSANGGAQLLGSLCILFGARQRPYGRP